MTAAEQVREIDSGTPMGRYARGWHCVGLAEADGAGYQHRRWYEQFYVDVTDVTDDMVDRFELEVDTTHAYAVWKREVGEDLRRRAESSVAAPQ